LGERAHFEIGAGADDPQDLAGAVRPFDELAQVFVRPVVGVVALARHVEHGRYSDWAATAVQADGWKHSLIPTLSPCAMRMRYGTPRGGVTLTRERDDPIAIASVPSARPACGRARAHRSG